MEVKDREKELFTELALLEAVRRRAKYSIHFVDNSKDAWSPFIILTKDRLEDIKDDGSIDKIRIEYDLY